MDVVWFGTYIGSSPLRSLLEFIKKVT